jgi:hypothetical protein
MKYVCVGENFKQEMFEDLIEADSQEQAKHEFLRKHEDLMKIKSIKFYGGDMVNHPSHYMQGNIECIDALKAATVNLRGIEAVCTANAIKYLWRWKEKNGYQDLEKAKLYINKLIEEVYNE